MSDGSPLSPFSKRAGSLSSLQRSTSAKNSFEGKGTPEINLISLTYSNKYDKIDEFLKKNTNLSLTSMRDIRFYNLLHIACLNSHEKTLRRYLNYAKANDVSDEEITRWINEKNEEGFTPLHFAAFKGSLELIKILESYGADLKATNYQGLSVMHISAQGDQPISLAYFLKKGFDIHERDDKGSTPLHWSAFLGMENATIYLTSWGADPNLKDVESGFTALHLGAVSGNIRIVRRLLVKGANKRVKDIDGKTPSDLAAENEYLNIVQLLKGRNWIVDCFNIKPDLQRKRNRLSLLFFITLYLSIVATNYVFLFPYIDQLVWAILYVVFVSITFVFFLLAWLTNPGYMQNKKADILSLLTKYEAHKICPECVILKPERSRHCDYCGACVAVFDHHCPWIDNCVGARNHKFFLGFVISTLFSVIYLTVFAVSRIGMYDASYEYWSIYFEDPDTLFDIKEAICAGDVVIMIVFGIPLAFLGYVQICNFITGKTTNERYGFKPQKVEPEKSEPEPEERSVVTVEAEYIKMEDRNKRELHNETFVDHCMSMCYRNQKDPKYTYEKYGVN